SGASGEADLTAPEAAARSIARAMKAPLIIVNKSTLPIGSGDRLERIVREEQPVPIQFHVVSNPEFLREGSAVGDFLAPDRVVLGSDDAAAAQAVAELYRVFK